MRIPHPALLAACVALAACGGGGSAGGPAAPPCVATTVCTPSIACRTGEVRCEASGPACVPTSPLPDGTACGEGATCGAGTCQRTVTVTAIDRYVDDAGDMVEVPRASLGDSAFRALVLGADGAYQAYPGSVVAPGVVEIPGVPVGTCLVERIFPGSAVPEYTEVIGNVLDDSSDPSGRPDAATSTLPTPVELAVTGLAPWRVGPYPEDRLEVVSSNFGGLWQVWEPGIAEGATAASVSPFSFGTPLLDAAAGDRVQVVQLGRVEGPVAYLAAVRAGTLPETFSVEDGVAQVVPIALGPIERTATLEVDWALGELEALLGEMGPAPPSFLWHQLTVHSYPHGIGHGSTQLEVPGPAGGGTVRLGPFTYGRPYPDFFVDGAEASMTVRMDVPLPPPLSADISVDAAVGFRLGSTAGMVEVRPPLSPPRAVRVAGRDVRFTVQRDVGSSPIISWSPPALGTATLYRVTLHRIDGYTRTVARFLTPSVALRVPAAILLPGATHFARVTAHSDTGYAQTVTAPFIP